MTKPSRGSDEKSSSPVSTGALLTLTFLDTTWRMAVPSVGMTVGGLLLDQRFNTTPWLMILGIISGSMLGIYLVYTQIKRVSGKNN